MRVVHLDGGRDGLWALGSALVAARDGDTLAIYDAAAEPFGTEALLTSRGVADVVVNGDTLLWANQRGAVQGFRVDGTRARKWGGFALPRDPEIHLIEVSADGLQAIAATPALVYVLDVSSGAVVSQRPRLPGDVSPGAPARTVTLGDTTVHAAAGVAASRA